MSNDLFQPSVDLGLLNVHLLSGEDILGHVFLETDTQTGMQTYKIERPATPMYMQDPSGRPRMALAPLRPYLPKATGSIDVLAGHIVWMFPLDGQIKDAYTQFSSDLIVAAPSNLDTILAEK